MFECPYYPTHIKYKKILVILNGKLYLKGNYIPYMSMPCMPSN